jgi:microsomal dipeptidase-like Zn-dependent dipeptidase
VDVAPRRGGKWDQQDRSKEMRARLILVFVFLLAFAGREAVCRDFTASIGKSGEVVSSNGVLKAVRYRPGHYEVTFERPINECRVSGTIGQDHNTTGAAEIITVPGHSGASVVSVETRAPGGTPTDFSFRLNVKCSEPEPEPQAPPAPLTGYVDLHTHPLANVGFGGKLLYGGVDVGALLPADPDCNQNVRATSMLQALGHDESTHGLWSPFTNPCGDSIRAGVIFAVQTLNRAASIGPDASGMPNFPDWPVWNDITHQKMWVDWIRRAFNSGLHVMVALAVNNKTLADASAGPCDYPTDDRTSADFQLAEIKGFVGRHTDFMEIALTADDLARIVRKNKLAIVLGTEIDNLGNLQKQPPPLTHAQISAEIDRLYGEGVRYIFPIHVLDNRFGGTAAYLDLFNYSTFREDGNYWGLVCANPPQAPDDFTETVNYQFTMSDPVMVDLLNVAGAIKLKTSFPTPPGNPKCSPQLTTAQPIFTASALPGLPTTTFDTINFLVITAEAPLGTNGAATATVQLRNGTALGPFPLKNPGDAAWGAYSTMGTASGQTPPNLSFSLQPPVSAADITQVVVTLTSPNTGGGANGTWSLEEFDATLSNAGTGQINLVHTAFGMQNGMVFPDAGTFAITEMMRRGMLIDIDHMSDVSKTATLSIASGIPGGYPVNSGHSGLRGFFPKGVWRSAHDVNDRSTSVSQYRQIASSHGMVGIGSAGLDAYQWAELYQAVLQVMNASTPGAVGAFGTDTDGFATGMPPRCNPPLKSTDTACTGQSQELSSVAYSDSFPMSSVGKITWNYNKVGVAHYGMLADFLQDVASYPGASGSAGTDVINNLNTGADYFYQTWKICEAQKSKVK